MTLRLLQWVAAGVGALLLLALLTVYSIPPAELMGVVVRLAARQGLSLTYGSVARSFPLGIKAERLILSEKSPLLAFDTFSCRVLIFPLFTGRLSFEVLGRGAEGELTVKGSLGKRTEIALAGKQLRLEKIPVFKEMLGGELRGPLELQGNLSGKGGLMTGAVQLSSSALELKKVTVGGVPLPDSIFRSVRGKLLFNGSGCEIQSFALEGDGIYARLSGKVPFQNPVTASPLDLALEFMPKPEFMEKQKLIFLVLSRFIISPGNYRIPVKGTLGAPSVL